MELERFTPSAALAPFIDGLELLETRAPMTRVLLPNAGLIVGFRYAGAAMLLDGGAARRLPDCVVTGPRGSVRHMNTTANSGVVLVKFREVGAAHFFSMTMEGLFGVVSALEDFVAPQLVASVSQRLKAAKAPAERVAIVEHFLLSQQRSHLPDLLLMRALRALTLRPGSPRISDLADTLRISQDALEKRFRRVLGAPPKRFASLLRLRRAISLYHPGASMTDLAFGAGYYDQPHFVREFRAATGSSPGAFFRAAEYC